jgi:hypothetical protein
VILMIKVDWRVDQSPYHGVNDMHRAILYQFVDLFDFRVASFRLRKFRPSQTVPLPMRMTSF